MLIPGDAAANSGWVARLPAGVQPYLRLMRADRPVGFWLLMWPCWWSTALALPPTDADFWRLLGLFLLGSIVMRGAGCTWNDIVDKEIDAKVARTAGRPIATGLVSRTQAFVFACVLSLIGLIVLLSLGNWFSVWLGTASLIPVALYPFAKRVTHWPQAVLGLTFNWGALMGWAAVYGDLAWPPVLLYLGCLFWTLGYDTIYAHMDKADDAIVGVKSTALKFGRASRLWIALFYGLFLLCLAAALALTPTVGGSIATIFLLGAAGQLGIQVSRLDIDDPGVCLSLFKSNLWVGWLVFLGFVLG
ncbi:MAG: 4-hydroxybenzoate octaprenyltransferase [Rhodothalassiaceae bacterium]